MMTVMVKLLLLFLFIVAVGVGVGSVHIPTLASGIRLQESSWALLQRSAYGFVA